MERVRFMRVFVFFDLPVETASERRAYRLFRKYLLNEGFLMLQESVYAKLVVTDAQAKSVVARLKENRPERGLVQALRVTEKQYASMEFIAGEKRAKKEVESLDGFVII